MKKARSSFKKLWIHYVPLPIQAACKYTTGHYLEYPLIALVLLSILIPVLSPTLQKDRYSFKNASTLLTNTPKALQKNISYDTKNAAYTYTPPADEQPQANSQSLGGTHYSANLSLHAKDGVTLTDTASKLGISLTPQFDTLDAKKIDSHVVYPLSGADGQLVYTFKGNGLKEDVVLYSSSTSEARFDYTLKLPAALEAKLQDDGSIGIYGGDSSLYGNISYGSDKDRALVQKAQAKSSKNSLMYVIPAPTVKGLGSKATPVKAKFSLNGQQLSIHVSHLTSAQYPLTIDPSLALVSTSDFGQGNDDENNIDFSVVGQVSRAGLTGGTVSSWTSAPLGGPITLEGFLAFNSYLYVVGGYSYAGVSTVEYAHINADGSLDGWLAGGNLTRSRWTVGTAVVTAGGNNYIYAVGGYGYNCTGASGTCTDADFAKINADGSLTAWAATSSLGTARTGLSYGTNNGYLYALGGCSNNGTGAIGFGTGCVTINSSTEFAKPNTDGTIPASGVGSWTATTAMPVTLYAHSTVINANRIYALGGLTSSSSVSGAIYSAALSAADGTIGAWSTSTIALPVTVYYLDVAVVSGKIYIFGGLNGAALSTVYYSGVDASGNITGWTAGTSLPTTNFASGVAVSGGRVFIGGGFTVAYTGLTGKVISAVINGDATVGSWTTGGVIAAARVNHASGVYNGYYYVWGGAGYQGDNLAYAKLNSNGTLGTWQEGPTLQNERGAFGGVIYNGALYGCGGNNVAGNPISSCEFAKINADGSVKAWQATAALTRATQYAATTVYRGYMYMLGGNTPDTVGNKQVAETLYARINADGTLGIWANTTAFTTKRMTATVSAYNGRMYLAGGCTDSVPSPGTCQTVLGDVQSAVINSNGTISAWTTGTSLPTLTTYASMAIYGGYIYMSGGSAGAGYLNRVIYAPVYASGDLGAWTTTTTLPIGIALSAMSISGGYALVSGGQDITGNVYNTVQIAKIDPAGALAKTAWTVGANMTSSRNLVASAVYNGYIYAAGGAPSFATINNSVDMAPINADGSIGTWTSTNAMLTTRMGFGLVAYNGYLYAIGGCTSQVGGACTAVVNTWESTPITAGTGALGPWVIYGGGATNNMHQARGFANATVYNGYIYFGIGAAANQVSFSTIEYAQVSGAGTLGTWTEDTTNTVSGSVGFQSRIEAWSGKLIIVPGADSTNLLYTGVANNGSLTGAWQSGSTMTLGLHGMSTAIYNGVLYVLGGLNGGTAQTAVYALNLSSTGVPNGTWRSVTSLTTTTAFADTVVLGGMLYITNVNGGTSGTNQSAYIPVNNGGRGGLGSWTTNGGASYPSPRFGHGSVVANGYLYVLGGCSVGSTSACTTKLNDVQFAKLNATGGMTAQTCPDLTSAIWCGTSSFGTARWFAATIYVNGYIYVIGGIGDVGTPNTVTDDIQYARLDPVTGVIPASGVGSWKSNPTKLYVQAYAVAAAAYNGYIYVTGEANIYNAVHYTQINATDGTLGSWTLATSYNTARSAPSTVTYAGYLYVMGGCGAVSVALGACTNYLNDVQYAKLTNTGNLSTDSGCGTTWCYATSLTTGKFYASAFVANGNLYSAGGVATGGNYSAVTEFASVLANGNLGSWQSTTSFATPRYALATTVGYGTVYLTGGYNGSAQGDTQYATLQSISRISHYSRLFATDKDTTPVNFIARFTSSGSNFGFSYATASVASPTYSTATSFSPTSDLKTSLPGSTPVAYNLFTFTLDDSANATFPDNASTATTLSYFQMNYHPNSTQRLRGGGTFNRGSLQSLDAP